MGPTSVILAAVALVASSVQQGFAPVITLTLTPPGIAPVDGGMIIVVTPTPVVLAGIRTGAAIATLLLFVAAMRLLLPVPAVRRPHATDAAADRDIHGEQLCTQLRYVLHSRHGIRHD